MATALVVTETPFGRQFAGELEYGFAEYRTFCTAMDVALSAAYSTERCWVRFVEFMVSLVAMFASETTISPIARTKTNARTRTAPASSCSARARSVRAKTMSRNRRVSEAVVFELVTSLRIS
jgi:hypothetical protein